jgi:hypothetical protein
MTTILVLVLVLTSDGKPVTKAWVEVEGDHQTNYYVEGVKQPEHVWVEKATDSRGMFIVEVEPGLHRVVIRLKEVILYERDVELARTIWAVWHREVDFQPAACKTDAA